MVFWGVEVKPGTPFRHVPFEEESNLHVSQATLGVSPKSKERVIVTATVGDESPVFICSLTAGLLESCPLDLIFDDEVTFSVSGSSSIHLTGYYMPSQFMEEDENFGEDESDEDEDEMETDDMLDTDDEENEDELTENPFQNSGVIIEEITDEEATGLNGKAGKGAVLKKIEVTGNGNPVVEEEDEDGFVKGTKRTAREEEANAQPSKKQATLGKTVDRLQNSAQKAVTAEPKEKEEDAPEKEIQSVLQSPAERKKKKKIKKKKQGVETAAEPADKAAAAKAVDHSPLKPAVSARGQTKAEALDKKTAPVPAADVKDSIKAKDAEKKGGAAVTPDKNTKPKPSVKTFPNGLEVHSISFGNPTATIAKQGKKVSMSYTGRLKSNGKIFDSNVKGKPFSFRLGVGEVIKGWDIGVQGMKVGDKRKLVIPPAMGYGAQGVKGTIPGNAWLEFDIELKDVK